MQISKDKFNSILCDSYAMRLRVEILKNRRNKTAIDHFSLFETEPFKEISDIQKDISSIKDGEMEILEIV